MPRLPEYDAPQRELTPSDKGASAFEQAGRRIGPAYNEAATLTREKGAVASDLIKQRRWPFDAQELYHSLDLIEKAKADQTGGGFRVEGGFGGGSDSGGVDRSGGKGHKSKSGADVGGMSIAAAGLGRLAGAMAKGNQYRNSEIDPRSGLDLSLPQNQPKGYTALENGQLVHYGANGQRLSPTPKDQFSGPNADAARAAQGSSQWTDPNIDWTDPKNAAKRTAEAQRTGVDPVNGQMQDTGRPNGVTAPYGSTGLDSRGNPIPPPDRDYGGGGDRSPGYDLRPQNPFDPAGDSSQPENPFRGLSPAGAAEAQGAVEDMRNQYDRSGAYTDQYAPSDSGASGGGSDDTTYNSGSGNYEDSGDGGVY